MKNNATITHRSLKAMNGHKRVRLSNRQLCMDSKYAQKQQKYIGFTQGNAFEEIVSDLPSTSIFLPAHPTHQSTHYGSPNQTHRDSWRPHWGPETSGAPLSGPRRREAGGAAISAEPGRRGVPPGRQHGAGKLCERGGSDSIWDRRDAHGIS